MTQETIQIGVRIRKVREERFEETRQVFAERCGFSENYLGKLERGEILIGTKSLMTICRVAGVDADFILFGKCKNSKLTVRNTIDKYLDHSSTKELKMYFKIISSITENILKN